MFAWSGSRTSHGIDYEKDLALTLFVAASLEERRFHLATEMNVAGKFDDAVLILDDRKDAWFFQAKHSQTSAATIEYKEFFPSSFDETTQFSLPMYIQSFLNVSQRSEFENYKKRFIIFSNKSIGENARETLGELMDIESCALEDPLEKQVFIRCSEKFVPKAELIQELLNKINELPIAIRDAIIELQKTGTVKGILKKYTTPLRSLLEIDVCVRFSDTFTGNEDEINQQWLWNELHTHFIAQNGTAKRLSEVVFHKKIEKRLLQNKSAEKSFPRFVHESDLRKFFDCFVMCTDQPDKLSPLRDSIIESIVRKWVHEKDRGLFSDRTKFHAIFENRFEKWHMVTNLVGNQKPFLSSNEGNECVHMIKAEVRKSLQKITEADFSNYVERKLVLQNGQEEFTEAGLISMLEQSSGQNDILILLGEPGMGKTTFMKKITCLLQSDFIKHVYLISLGRLFKDYEEEDDIFTLLKSTHSNSIGKLLQKSLEYCSQQSFILLDGFDEIDASHQDPAVKLIEKTFCKNNSCVLISGRNHVKEVLEREFIKVKTSNLVPLVEDEQLLFLRKSWNISSELDEKDIDRFQRFSKHLLQILHDNIRADYFCFTGLPLVARMLAEVYKKKFEKYWESANANLNEILESNNRFSVLQLYENFVNISFNIFLKKILNEEGYVIVDLKIKNFFKDNLNKFYRAHHLIAIQQLNIRELRRKLCNNDSVTILENMQLILDDGEKSLLINVSNKNQFEFTHLSYAEYFLSNFLYEHVIESEASLVNVLRVYEVIRVFFFSMVEENWDKSSLQIHTIHKVCYYDPAIMYLACSGGYEKILKELLIHHNPKVIFRSLPKSGTLLHAAVQSRKENILRLVLCDLQFGDCTSHEPNNYTMKMNDTEIDINTPDQHNALPIHYAVTNGNKAFVRVLAQHGADKNINAQDGEGKTPLHYAAENSDWEMIKMLTADYAANPNIQDYEGQTILCIAAAKRDSNMVKMIEELSCDVNANDSFQYPPLLHAAEFGTWETVKMLIEKYNADYKITNKDRQTPIHLAAKAGNKKTVKMLLDNYEADVNAQDNAGNTPLHFAADYSKWELVKMVIDQYSVDCKVANKEGQTLIHGAARDGNMELVKMLIDDHEADVNARDIEGNTPLQLAAELGNWEMVKMLVDTYSVDYKIRRKKDGNTLIHLAISEGEMEIVQILIDDYSVDVNSQNNDGYTPLNYAADCGKWEIVEMLLDKYPADYKTAEDFGRTPIHFAARDGMMEIVKMLIDDYAADVNTQDYKGYTPLLLAADCGKWNIVKMLIDKCSVDYKIADKDGRFLIHFAAGQGMMEIVKMIVDNYEADVNAQDNDGNTPLHLAAQYKRWEMVKTLIKEYPVDYKISNKDGKTLIHLATEDDDMEMVQMLIDDYEANVNAQDNDGETPFYYAAYHGQWEMVKMFITKFAVDCKISFKDGKTLIHFAVKDGMIEIVNMLIDEYAADVNAQDNDGNTPLLLAADYGKWEMVKMIIDKDSVDYKTANRDGMTLIHCAARQGMMEIVEMLVDNYEADPNSQDNDGNTPLHLAIAYGWQKTVKMLIGKHSVDYTIANNDGNTPIHLAIKDGMIEIVEMLLDNYAVDVNAQEDDGNTLLHLAAKYSNLEMFNMLIDKYSMDYKMASKTGKTLIHFAASGGNMKLVQMLLDNYEADVNAQDNDGNTPLHLAAENNKLKMVKMLINKYSVDYKITNKYGQTPIHSAARNGATEIVELLLHDSMADVNMQDNNGNTPLLLAANFPSWETVKVLIHKYSVDYKIANKDGNTLIHFAARYRYMEIINMLIDDYSADVNAQDSDGNTQYSKWEMIKMLMDKYSVDYKITNEDDSSIL
ncbi:serine/threonine-protein phosphatase 6 regulatory ankyrin repeat subunit A-like [Aedes albopictus]|uniref:NACHT domain-containing protein n=1 Tax=Aedes albopictus TaxID=7160 RepID=A0ABM1Y3G4_AEDAL